MGEYTKTFLIAGKIVHPRVAKVLESLSQLSPLIVPRDADQPKQGYLLKLREGRQNYLIEQFSPVELKKPQISLNLNSSLLKRRKVS